MSILHPLPTQQDIHVFKDYYKAQALDAWSEWEDKKEMFYRVFPELEIAFNNLNAAQEILDTTIAGLEYDPAWHDYLD